MFVICKFFKRITIISDQTNWKTIHWIKTLLIRFDVMNWSLFKQIISDQDRKFLNDFWNALFTKLKIRLFYSTIYYFQTNEFLKRINQSIKIGLKYHLTALNSSISWSEILFAIQRFFNNSVSFTDRISNEIVYEFIFIESADLLRIDFFRFNFFENEIFNFKMSSNLISAAWIWQKVADVIIFFNLVFKHHYDQKHKTIRLFVENWILLRFHWNYSISSTTNLKKKLFQQFVKFFKIFQQIKNFVYKLEISVHWRIHSVFIII